VGSRFGSTFGSRSKHHDKLSLEVSLAPEQVSLQVEFVRAITDMTLANPFCSQGGPAVVSRCGDPGVDVLSLESYLNPRDLGVR
jgi:hypothetical protein